MLETPWRVIASPCTQIAESSEQSLSWTDQTSSPSGGIWAAHDWSLTSHGLAWRLLQGRKEQSIPRQWSPASACVPSPGSTAAGYMHNAWQRMLGLEAKKNPYSQVLG